MVSVLVCGTNDVASAVAHRLFLAGYAVALVDGPEPAATRRGMAFDDAVHGGRAEVGGVEAVRAADPAQMAALLAGRRCIPILCWPITSSVTGPRTQVPGRPESHATGVNGQYTRGMGTAKADGDRG